MAFDKNGYPISDVPVDEQVAAANKFQQTLNQQTPVAMDSGQIVETDNPTHITMAALSNNHSVDPNQVFTVKKYDGTIAEVDGVNLQKVLGSGEYILETNAEKALRQDNEKYGNKEIQAAALGAARGLTFGLSDQIAKGSGAYTADELRGMENANTVASIGGEVVGAILPAIFSGGTSATASAAKVAGTGIRVTEALGAKAAATISERIAAKATLRAEGLLASEAGLGAKALAEAGEAAATGATTLSEKGAEAATSLFAKSLEKGGYAAKQAQSIASKMLYGAAEHMAPDAANLAVQGALQGAGRLVTEDAFGTADFNAENLLAYAGMGALVGGTFGATIGAGKALVPKASELLKPVASKVGEVFESVLSKEKAAIGLVDMNTVPLAKAVQKRPNFVQLMTDKTEEVLHKFKPKDETAFIKALLDEEKAVGVKIGEHNTLVDGMLKESGAPTRTAFDLKADMVKSVDDMFSKTSASMTAAEKNAVFNYSDELIGNLEKDLTKNGITMENLQKHITDFGERAYAKGKGALVSSDDATRQSVLKRLRDVMKNEQMKVTEDVASRTGNNAEQLLEMRRKLNQDYSVLKDMNYNSNKKLAAGLKSDPLKISVDMKDAAAAVIDPASAIGFKAARLAMNSFAVQKRLAMGSLEQSGRKMAQAMSTGLTAMAKGTQVLGKAAEPTVIRSIVSSELAVRNEDGKKLKPRNEAEAYANIIENANQSVTDPESVLMHSNKQTAALYEHAPNTAAAIDAKYLQMLQFIASKAKKSNKNTGIFDTKSLKPSGFETAKMARYLDAISNPHSMIEKASKGRLSREHVEVMQSIFPEMHKQMKTATLGFISKNKDKGLKLSYQQQLQLGQLLGVQAHESSNPANVQALQSMFAQEPSSAAGGSEFTPARADKVKKSEAVGSGVYDGVDGE